MVMSSIMRARNGLTGRGEVSEVIKALSRAEGCWTFDARDQMPRTSRATARHPAKNAPTTTRAPIPRERVRSSTLSGHSLQATATGRNAPKRHCRRLGSRPSPKRVEPPVSGRRREGLEVILKAGWYKLVFLNPFQRDAAERRAGPARTPVRERKKKAEIT